MWDDDVMPHYCANGDGVRLHGAPPQRNPNPSPTTQKALNEFRRLLAIVVKQRRPR